jgi:hypothetical protein
MATLSRSMKAQQLPATARSSSQPHLRDMTLCTYTIIFRASASEPPSFVWRIMSYIHYPPDFNYRQDMGHHAHPYVCYPCDACRSSGLLCDAQKPICGSCAAMRRSCLVLGEQLNPCNGELYQWSGRNMSPVPSITAIGNTECNTSFRSRCAGEPQQLRSYLRESDSRDRKPRLCETGSSF